VRSQRLSAITIAATSREEWLRLGSWESVGRRVEIDSVAVPSLETQNMRLT
jgi:hypothetical protein